jgi:HK97 family phage portal protein
MSSFELGPSGERVEIDEKAWGSISVPSAMPWYGSIRESFTGAWQKNITVEPPENMFTFSAVYACISRIADDISPFRLMLMAESGDGAWDEVKTGSPFLPVLRKPNRYQTRIQFLHQWLTLVLTHGNNYVYLDRDRRGVVVGMYNLDPRGVRPMVAPDGEVFYQLSQDYLTGISDPLIVPASEIIHDRMITPWHPLCGISPLFACAMSTTQGMRIQTNSARFFENMSRPSGILAAPGNITNQQVIDIKKSFEEGFGGANLGRLFVVSGGMKYEAMTIPATDAQLVEQLKLTVEDIARAFHVPLYMINAGHDPTLSNIGAKKQDYYTQTLRKRIEDIELLLDEALGLPALGMGVWMELEGLLRMDHKARAETTEIEIRSAVISPDEARLQENRHPVAGGNSPYLQQQNYSLAALAKRDALADPFGTAKPPAPQLASSKSIDDDGQATEFALALIAKFSEATHVQV